MWGVNHTENKTVTITLANKNEKKNSFQFRLRYESPLKGIVINNPFSKQANTACGADNVHKNFMATI